MEIEIEYLGVRLDVHYTVNGKFYPATHYTPAEYPEVEITKVFARDVDISEILLDVQMDDIYELLNDKLEL